MRPRLPALSLAALVLAAAPARAETAQIEEARRHMKAGAALYNDPSGHKCEEALREFRKAYDLSRSLNALKGMAICNLELERDGDAIEQYTAYLAGKGSALEAGERAQVEADLSTLRAAVANVTISTDRDDVRVTDVRTPAKGYPIRNTYVIPAGGKRLGVHPGQHVLVASAPGQPDQTWSVEILNGGTYAHTFTFTPHGLDTAPATVRPVPAAVYVTAGLTVALAVPWVVFAVRAKQSNDAYQALNGKAPAAQLEEMRNDVKTGNLLADIFMGATAASLTATAILFFTRPSRPAPPAPRAGILVSPAVGVGGGGAVLNGWF
jgi:hypothetical protein